MTGDRIEITGPGLADMVPVPLDDFRIGVERVLDQWREDVRGLDLEKLQGIVALAVYDDGEAYGFQPVQLGKPAAWVLGLSLALCATVRDAIVPSASRERLLALLEGLALSQSDFLNDSKRPRG